ncbi:sensor histidine kinase [Kribbella jejuensis]
MDFSRLRANGRRVDVVVAAALAVVAVVQLVALAPADAGFAVPLALAVCAGVGLRRSRPFWVGVGAQTLMAAGGWLGITRYAGPLTVAWFCALYGLAVWTSDKQFAIGTAYFVITDLVPWHDPDQAVPFAVGGALVMWLLRLTIRSRDLRLDVAQREYELAAREARLDERIQIARDLHDVVAHHVSAIVVQAASEGRRLEPGETRDVLELIEQVGRSALDDMRRMVAVLRSDGTGSLEPQPGIEDIPLLVQQVTSAGLSVGYGVTGRVRPLPLMVQLAAYRTVQEALTNALKHAGPAQATVSVHYGERTLAVSVADDGLGDGDASLPGGHGLKGLAERIESCGGRLTHGPVPPPRRGFAVSAEIPVGDG